MAPVLLLVGEIIPKSVALTYPEPIARFIARPLQAVLPLLTPARVVLFGISRGLMSSLGVRPEDRGPLVKEDDFLRMVEDSHRGGLIAPLERELIQNLLTFGDVSVAQIMVPRPDIFSLPFNLPLAELIQAVKRARYSRIPMYGDDNEDILGILHAKDLLNVALHLEANHHSLKNILRPPYYVPENKRAFDLLGELQARKLRLALVVDEYGSLTGLVTVEDIMEELSGEIEEEFVKSGAPLMQLVPGVYQVSGRMHLAEFAQTLGLTLPSDEFDTVGGFVFNLFGRLPREGDVVAFENLQFEILRMKGTRIMDVLVSLE
jgi:CBS domain containing-hemolysin-like protein